MPTLDELLELWHDELDPNGDLLAAGSPHVELAVAIANLYGPKTAVGLLNRIYRGVPDAERVMSAHCRALVEEGYRLYALRRDIREMQGAAR